MCALRVAASARALKSNPCCAQDNPLDFTPFESAGVPRLHDEDLASAPTQMLCLLWPRAQCVATLPL